jgi:hypothetical protein
MTCVYWFGVFLSKEEEKKKTMRKRKMQRGGEGAHGDTS